MARRGIFGRIREIIRNVVAPPQRGGQLPPRPPEPPKRERDPYRAIWKRDHGKGNYRKNLEVFHRMVDPIEDDEQERLELWDSFVRNIVNGEGQYRRQDTRNLFWRDSGIDPGDFRWQDWRLAMGYTGKRRSRS